MRQKVTQHGNHVWQAFQEVAFLHPQRQAHEFLWHELHELKHMAKLTTDFILIDESVVMYGFRALMSGAKLAGFIDNPVMLYMHNRSTPGLLGAMDTDTVMPIGKWYDIRIEGDKLLAKPDFDDNDAFALKVQSKVEGGYLKGASIFLEPSKASDEAALKLAGQRGPTVTEWGVLEASIVDIPNCRNSLAIKNSAGNKIVLSGNYNNNDEAGKFLLSLIDKNNTMDKKLLCAKLGLDENATDAQISEALVALKNGSESAVQLAAEKNTLGAEIIRLKAEATNKKITDLVDGAITATKLMAGDRDKWVKLATADYETVEAMITNMKPYKSIEAKLADEGKNSTDVLELEGLVKLSGEQLYMAGKLERLKELDKEQFKLKYKEALGVEFKEA
jgi:hypothetical protein